MHEIQQIKINDIVIDIIRKNIKNLHLAVYPPSGRVRIASPLKLNNDSLRLFAISKMGWIKKQQLKYQAVERQSARKYVSGESHYFLGKRYLLNVVSINKGKIVITLRNKSFIDFYVPITTSAMQRQRHMDAWYREQLIQKLQMLIPKWQRIMNIEIANWRIKKMKTKWGSCNTQLRRIWFNLELAKTPERCLEYILIHEMVHFLERNHNDRFKSLMNKFMPQWQNYREELKYSVLGV